MSLDKNYIKETLTTLGRKYGMRETFEDFVYCCAYSISNLTNFNENREQEYLSISKKYQKEEFNLFAEMLFAYLSLLKENNIDINNVYFVGADISNLCCCMTYVNLSLRGASAIINHQDTLLLKKYGYYITPGLFLNKNLVHKLIDSGYLELIKKTELQQNKELENSEEDLDIER